MGFYFLVALASYHFDSSYIGLRALITLHSQVKQFQRHDQRQDFWYTWVYSLLNPIVIYRTDWLSIIQTLSTRLFLLKGARHSASSLLAHHVTKIQTSLPSAVCDLYSLVDLLWYIAALGISHMSLSSAVRLSPAALDSSLIYSEVGEGWCR